MDYITYMYIQAIINIFIYSVHKVILTYMTLQISDFSIPHFHDSKGGPGVY